MADGFLIVWSDVQKSMETDYSHWLTREHAQERVSTPGFLAVRVFRTELKTTYRYLIVYDLESPDVVSSPAYVAKLNSPSPWTQRVLPTLTNFMRGGGRVAHQSGIGAGSTATALTLPEQLPADSQALVKSLAACDRISAVRLYETDSQRTEVKTKEKEVRGGDDRSFAGMLLIEGLDGEAVTGALDRLKQLCPDVERDSPVGSLTYSQLFALEKRMLPA